MMTYRTLFVSMSESMMGCRTSVAWRHIYLRLCVGHLTFQHAKRDGKRIVTVAYVFWQSNMAIQYGIRYPRAHVNGLKENMTPTLTPGTGTNDGKKHRHVHHKLSDQRRAVRW